VKTFSLLFLASCLFVLASCLPEQRFWWSPKGDRALVLLDDGLHLASADGKLGGAMDGFGKAGSVSWLSDGSGFVCSRTRVFQRWNEVRALLPESEVAEIEERIPLMPILLEAAARQPDKLEILGKMTRGLEKGTLMRSVAAMRIAHERDRAGMEKLLGTLPDGDKMVKALQSEGFEVVELCLVKLDGSKPETRVLLTSMILEPTQARVSPKHPLVAYLTADEDGETFSLKVMPLAGGASRHVDQHLTYAYDWRADGESLIFIERHDSNHPGTIRTRRLADTTGELLDPEKDRLPDGSMAQTSTRYVATVADGGMGFLRSLPDGRVLLKSTPFSLPAVGAESGENARLYIISADLKKLQEVPCPQGALPSDIDSFSVSPDGRRVALVQSNSAAVSVVEIDSGKVQIISPAHPQWSGQKTPAWKSNTELTFVAPHGTAQTPQWMQWNIHGETRCLSQMWPEGSTKEWLSKEKESEAPGPR